MLCCGLEGLRWLWEADELQQQGGQTRRLDEQTAFAVGEEAFCEQNISGFLTFDAPTALLGLTAANSSLLWSSEPLCRTFGC